MVVALLLALAAPTRVSLWASGGMQWEEPPADERLPGYHPRLRFNRESTFAFVSPDGIAEGHYETQGTEYFFRPETVFLLNHADVDKLVADLDPESRQKQQEAYTRALTPFGAGYNPSTGGLSFTYPVKGAPQGFTLYSYTAGDEQRASSLSNGDRGVAGLWTSPDPFPERLDSKTRYRIGGLDGLRQFFHEAMASDSAQFGLLDLRVDKSFRSHSEEGAWRRNGSTVVLSTLKGDSVFTISSDGQKLQAGGKTVFVRA